MAASFFELVTGADKMIFASVMMLGFLLSFVITLLALARIITDKDDSNTIRMRDIILGQKAYIDKYYESRRKEIDSRLGIEILEKREESIEFREYELARKEEANQLERLRLEQENRKLNDCAESQLTVILPERKSIVLDQAFMDVMPSYMRDLSRAYSAFKQNNNDTLAQDSFDLHSLKVYLVAFATYIMDYLFPSEEVRVHFRWFNPNNDKYELLCALTGKDKRPESKLTSIPFSKTMIEKSFRCKRSVLKSINPDADYKTLHHTKWKDYLTLAFWTILLDGVPALTMGISVKNPRRYRNLFFFLQFVEFDIFVNDCMEEIDGKFDIIKVLYGEST